MKYKFGLLMITSVMITSSFFLYENWTICDSINERYSIPKNEAKNNSSKIDEFRNRIVRPRYDVNCRGIFELDKVEKSKMSRYKILFN